MAGTAQVLYRKWRPQQFEDLVGQEHVTQTLKRAILEGKLAHAYLFCGPRGTGKTSTARILAKALNCRNAHEGEPDGTCDHCVAVVENRMMDLIEIDAASNRGIDDIRNLRDKIQFSPTTGRYKVYIVDEVHMLTEPAFNALLKTLEEPPSHAVMVLATTEPQKVPTTIISRCQRHDFRRIPNDAVVGRLRQIAEAEGFDIEPEALAVVARSVWGSLRDAANLLEQLAISYEGRVTAENARELLGIGDTSASVALARSLLAGDAAQALTTINEQARTGADLRTLQAGTVDALRAALLIKTGVNDALTHPEEVVKTMREAASRTPIETILNALSQIGEANLKHDSSSPLPLELAVVRAVSAASRPSPASAAPAHSSTSRQPATQTPSAPRPQRRAPAPAPRPDVSVREPSRTPAPSPTRDQRQSPASPDAADPRWAAFVKSLARTKGKRYVLGAILRGANTHVVQDNVLLVQFTYRSNFERMEEELGDPRGRRAFEDAAEAAFGVKLTVKAAHGTDEPSSEGKSSSPMDSPLVRAALTMGGRIIGDTPADDGGDA